MKKSKERSTFVEPWFSDVGTPDNEYSKFKLQNEMADDFIYKQPFLNLHQKKKKSKKRYKDNNDIKTLKKKLKNITDQIDEELKNGDIKRRSPDMTKSLDEDQIQESFHFPPLLGKNDSKKSIDIKIEY